MVRRVLAGLLALAGWGSAAAQTTEQAAPAPMSVAASRSPTCALPLVADTVTLEDIADSNLRTVPVTINGAKKRFLLDIGTHPSEVSQATVSQLNLPDVKTHPRIISRLIRAWTRTRNKPPIPIST